MTKQELNARRTHRRYTGENADYSLQFTIKSHYRISSHIRCEGSEFITFFKITPSGRVWSQGIQKTLHNAND
jgi:hypothetical protein